MLKTGIVRDEFYKKHSTGLFHPESPERLEIVYRMLDQENLNGRFATIMPREATEEEITAIHTPEYYQRIAETAKRNRLTYFDRDTTACPETFMAAKLAAGGILSLADLVQTRALNNGFALVRPPGHHAEADRAMGFCIFNNVAIAARYLINRFHLTRVLIVDWDLHHGNATQHSFYHSSQVLFFSTHQYPHYPGTGGLEEAGEAEGKGYTVNVPLGPGAGDNEFIRIYRELLQPLAREFQPEFILVSAGFDTHHQDPLGGMQVTAEGFAALAALLMESADTLCQGRLAVTLEGGYHLEGLRESVRAVLLQLAGNPISTSAIEQGAKESSYPIDSVIAQVRQIQKRFWKCFA
jgi:acetoin utilization deacetylase AcuC-like enzyme